MSVVTMRELLEAGVHFGHQTRRWNPKMKRFIFGERGGIYIIDLQQTLERLEEAHAFARNLAERGGTVLFVGTKKQAQDAVAEQAQARRDALRRTTAGSAACSRTGGRSPTGSSVCTSCAGSATRASSSCCPPKERIAMLAELEKLDTNLGGVADMRKQPDARLRRSTCARSSSPCARRDGSACRSSRSSTRTATPTRRTT